MIPETPNFKYIIPSLPLGTWEGRIRTTSREPLLFVPSQPIMGVQDRVWTLGEPIDLRKKKVAYDVMAFWCNMTGVTMAELESAIAEDRKREREAAAEEAVRKLHKAARTHGFRLVKRAKPKRRKK